MIPADPYAELGPATIIRGDARHLPLGSDSDSVKFPCPLIERFEAFTNLGMPASTASTLAPDRYVGLGHENTPSDPHTRNVSEMGTLIGDRLRSTRQSRSLQQRQQRLTINHVWDWESATFPRRVDLPYLQNVEGLVALDPKEGQEFCADTNGHRRVCLPNHQGASSFGCRLSVVAVTAKHLVKKINCVRRDLFDRYPRRVDGLRCIPPDPHGVRAAVHADVSIRVDNTRRVGEIGGSF